MTFDLVVRGARIFLDGDLRPAQLAIRDGRVAEILDPAAPVRAAHIDDAGDLVVTPGLVDTHVHVNEPGRTEWEGFRTATEAALAGGITTVVDMPLNCIPATTTTSAAETKRAALEGQLSVDVGFWGGVVPGNEGELEGLAALGVFGAKCFLVPSGVDEFPHVTESDLDRAMPIMTRLGLPLLVHAELPGPIAVAEARLAADGASSRAYATYLASRPPEAEDEAIALMIALARRHGTQVHIVHLSSASAIPLLRAAQADGVAISAETCLHYLSFAAEEIPDGSTTHKCAPPIRGRDNREGLWRGLESGVISALVSDHSPCTPGLKCLGTGDFLGAWGGIASLQLGLSGAWTLASERGLGLRRVMSWSAEGTARLLGLEGRKGTLAVGADADLVMWDDAAERVLTADALRFRHRVSPYVGRTLRGVVARTYLGGRLAFADGEPVGEPRGRFIMRSPPSAG